MTVRYKTCPRCQQKAVPDMQVCGRCGQPYKGARRGKAWYSIAVLAVAVIALLAIGIVFLRPAPVVGTWVDEDPASEGYALIFNRDGTGTFRDKYDWTKFRWSFRQNILFLEKTATSSGQFGNPRVVQMLWEPSGGGNSATATSIDPQEKPRTLRRKPE
jgi:hypothetical protein